MATDSNDFYIKEIAEKGFGSSLLAELAAPTLNTEYVVRMNSGKNGINLIKVPKGYLLVGYSSGGDYSITDPREYAASVVDELLGRAKAVGAKPIAFASVIDARDGDEGFIRAVGEPFREEALEHGFSIVNGELALCGDMINCPCNIAGTMLGMVERGRLERKIGKRLVEGGTEYYVFDPEGKYVWMNSDGVGTKGLVYARMRGRKIGMMEHFFRDLLAMQADDKAKFGGGAVASFNVFESQYSGYVADQAHFTEARLAARKLEKEIGIQMIVQCECVGDRLTGPNGENGVFNAGGTLVSLVDDETFKHMPTPKEGDYLIAIKGHGRSNGFRDRRKLMVDFFGKDWHKTTGGDWFGEFLTEPSIIFYPVFVELLKNGLATSVYHMSGGAHRDKLSAPLAKAGLGVEIGVKEDTKELFAPDPREIFFAAFSDTLSAYTKFAMGNEGFVTTDNPMETLIVLSKHHLEARVVGKLEKRFKGVRLKAFNGQIVDFSSN